MKKIFTLIMVGLAVASAALAQAPNKFGYQAVVRNASGIVVPNGTSVSFRFTIRDGSSGGTIIYRETQNKTTNNAFGLVNLEVGSGTVVQGVYPNGTQWSSGAKFFQIEVDPAGGSSYTDMGAVQMISVPYANFSGTSANLSGTVLPSQITAGGASSNQVLKYDGTNWVPGLDSNNEYFAGQGLYFDGDTLHSTWTANGQDVYNNHTGNVGIGTNTPVYKLDVLHGGSTGIRVKSSSSFSAIDIDAASGDAALRFQKAGVNQWNLRNRPADDNMELFELGGGGSRLVVQNGTGNLGINQDNPKYKLDVGGSGRISDSLYVGKTIGINVPFSQRDIHIKALSSLSGVRISGTANTSQGYEFIAYPNTSNDAYLWNWESGKLYFGTNNTFRMMIDAAGNVGIGNTTPGYRLEVTGSSNRAIYGTSTVTSNVDGAVYGSNSAGPTAALATQNNGIYAKSVVSSGAAVFADNNSSNSVGYAGYFSGRLNVAGTLSKASGSFKIDHPQDPANKWLYHSFVESPDMMNIYNGNVVLDNNGNAEITLPAYFESLNMEFRYQLSCIGGYAPVYISKKVSENKFSIAGGTPGLEVSWQVTGIRHDNFAKANPIIPEVDKDDFEKGFYQNPEVFGLPKEKGIPFKMSGNAPEVKKGTPVVPEPNGPGAIK